MATFFRFPACEFSKILIVLGAMDPEMEAIKNYAISLGLDFIKATKNGKPIWPADAYRPGLDVIQVPQGKEFLVLVEVQPPLDREGLFTVVVDHHNPGDPGYGRDPEDYLQASSLGQFMALFGLEATPWDCLIAAGDHCPAHAYQGECPGIDPKALMRMRLENASKYKKKSVEELIDLVEKAREIIRKAPSIDMGGVQVKDLRGSDVPELPEASLREGVAVVCSGLPHPETGEQKCNLMGAVDPRVGQYFKETWALAQGYLNPYGDPDRGILGAYIALPKPKTEVG